MEKINNKLREQIMLYMWENYGIINEIVRISTVGRNSSKDFEDICQDVYLMCCEAIERNPHYITFTYEGEIEKVASLSTIVKNKCYDVLRKNNSRGNYDRSYLETMKDYPDDMHDDIHEINGKDMARSEVEKIKDLIPEDSFKIFEMVSQGYNQNEIAEELGITRNQVAKKIMRSRRLIDKTLK